MMSDIWWLLIANLLLLAANLADWWTTERALSIPGTVEKNPLMASAMTVLGRFWVVKKVAMTHGAVLTLGAWMPLTASAIAVGGAVLFGVAAARNHAIHRRARAEGGAA